MYRPDVQTCNPFYSNYPCNVNFTVLPTNRASPRGRGGGAAAPRQSGPGPRCPRTGTSTSTARAHWPTGQGSARLLHSKKIFWAYMAKRCTISLHRMGRQVSQLSQGILYATANTKAKVSMTSGTVKQRRWLIYFICTLVKRSILAVLFAIIKSRLKI